MKLNYGATVTQLDANPLLITGTNTCMRDSHKNARFE